MADTTFVPLPIVILLEPVVILFPALYQSATFHHPLVTRSSANEPIQTFLLPVVAISVPFIPMPILSIHRKCIYAVLQLQISNLLHGVAVPRPIFHHPAIGLLFTSTQGLI